MSTSKSLKRRDQPGWFDPNTVFIVMSFDTHMKKIYSCIRDECHKVGLNATRADEIPGSGSSVAEIKDYLERSEFIICDLSNARPNVYYELGLAQGVGNEPLDIFLIAREGTTLHFDVRSFRVRHYRSTRDLRALIKTQFIEMVNARREKEKTASNKRLQRKPLSKSRRKG